MAHLMRRAGFSARRAELEQYVALGYEAMVERLLTPLENDGIDQDIVDRYYIDGGFVQVEGNVVSVLTGRAVPANELDGDVAEEQLRAATKRPANSPELLDIRDRAMAQARAQMRIARKPK